MSTNFASDPLSNKQIIGHANALRRYDRLADLDVPDVFALLQRRSILTRFGEKKFDYQVVDDLDLGGDEAITLINEHHVRIRLSRSTYSRVRDQDRRARMTLAHEFMHCVLHRNEAPLARARQETVRRVIKPYVSVEHQAQVGASAYLITDAMVRRAGSIADLVILARVSQAAAEIRWEQEQQRIGRDSIREGLHALAAELSQASNPVATTSNAQICPNCGNRTLLSIGVRYLCTGPCDRVIDGFADGDGPQD